MTILFSLEDFSAPAPLPDTPPRTEDLPGYDAGYAAALADMAARQAQLSDATAQAISDITFGFAEARLHLLADLGPLFRTLIDKVLPASLPDSFRAHVAAQLVAAAKADINHAFRLCLHPQQVAAVTQALPAALRDHVTVDGDPSLSLHAATIARDRHETALDHDALHADIVNALSALFDALTERQAHG